MEEEFAEFLRGAREQCLHRIERVGATKCSASDPEVCENVLAVARSLFFIENIVMWASEKMQERYQGFVNELGQAMTGGNVNLEKLSERVQPLLESVLKIQQPTVVATGAEKEEYIRRLNSLEKQVQKLHNQISNISDRITGEELTVLATNVSKLDNMVCNVRAHLNKKHVNKTLLDKIMRILKTRVRRMKNDCTLWDKLVDQVAPLFDNSYVPRCLVRRGSRSA